MALTLGKAPFGHQPGNFNSKIKGPERVLYWEDYPIRIRLEFNGKIIADSRQIKALHETKQFMVLYFPKEDIKEEYLEKSNHSSNCPFKGKASYWNIVVNEQKIENAVWAYENPIQSAPFLKGYKAFYFSKVDARYQEEKKGYARPRNPYHRVDVYPASQHVLVKHKGKILAETNQPQLLFETGIPKCYYIPAEDVKTEGFRKSDTVSECPYKGDGQHWHLELEKDKIEDVCWSIKNPCQEGHKVEGYFSFYTDKVEIEVDGRVI